MAETDRMEGRDIMRKVILSEFVSLDGVIEDPAWTMPYWNDDIAKFKFGELFASDALLLGRVTYQSFAAAWPSKEHAEAMENAFSALPSPGAFSARMNDTPKFVASSTLTELEWKNSNLLNANLIEEVEKLKQKPGENILLTGSVTVARTLMRHNLIDEIHLLVFPILIGHGKRLFDDGCKGTLELQESRTLGPKVVHLFYRAND
jgi:dihydrofolate reductase